MTPLVWLFAALASGIAFGVEQRLEAEASARAVVLAAGLLIVASRLGWAGHQRFATLVACPAIALLGAGVGGAADARAWSPPGIDLVALEQEVATRPPVRLVGTVRRDASLTPAGQVAIDVDVSEVHVDGDARPTRLGIRLTVSGAGAPHRRGAWTRGRRIDATVASLRRPLPYANFGTPDAERTLARQGLRAFATVKSDALVEVFAGPWWEEWAAGMRAAIRQRVARHVHDPDRAAIVTAILIGDRSRMAPETMRSLQHAGVYHVVAISGGNVAIWLAALVLLPRAGGWGLRLATVWLVAALLVAALVVDGGASVSRAVLVALLALAVRWWDVRAPAAQVLALAGTLLLLRDPLAIHDPGLLLSFGAAAALVGLASLVAGRAAGSRSLRVAAAVVVLVVSTLAVEAMLMPVSLVWFSVATAAGVVANLIAVPAMGVVQIVAPIVVAAADLWPQAAAATGTIASGAVALLLRSAVVVEWAPFLVREAPPPSSSVVAAYYAGGALVAWAFVHESRPRPPVSPRSASRHAARGALVAGAGLWAVSLAAMLTGGRDTSAPAPWTWPAASAWQHAAWPREPWLVVTILDVGQGDATVVRFPSGATWLIDAGGSISESFDVGQRVTTPALWALGHRQLARLVVTHAHPDHANGVPAVLRRLRPRELLTGVPVRGDLAATTLSDAAARAGVPERRLAAGESFADGPVHLRVLHPERPDWERRRVRNDDSVVLWLRMGDVGVLLPGDVGQAIEQRWVNRVAAAPLTVLRLAHHGSASSTSPVLLDALRPVLAIASAGRGNRFGHPSAAVVRRVHDSAAVLLRTDEDGAVQVATNGRVLLVRTARGRSGGLSAVTPRHAWWPATPLPSGRESPLRASGRHRPGGSQRRESGG